MHKGGESAVSPVGNSLVDKVEDEDDLSPPEVVTSPQQDPDHDEHIVQDKMGRDIRGSCHDSRVLVEQMPNIAKLGEEEKDPGMVSLVLHIHSGILYPQQQCYGTYQ